MFGIGVPEFILILVIGLIVFGPGKLPEMARSLGKGMREFKKATNALSQAINEPIDTPVRSQQQAAAQQPAAQPQPLNLSNNGAGLTRRARPPRS